MVPLRKSGSYKLDIGAQGGVRWVIVIKHIDKQDGLHRWTFGASMPQFWLCRQAELLRATASAFSLWQ
jgi:hypothetical protein